MAIEGISGFGGGVSVIKAQRSPSRTQASRETTMGLVSRFRGQKVVDSLTSGLDFSGVDDQAPHESLLARQGTLSSTLGKAAATLDLQSLFNPFANLPQVESSSKLTTNLKEAKFDLSNGLERYNAEQVAALIDTENTVENLQNQLNITAEAVDQAQEALRNLGFDSNGHAYVMMSNSFFAAGKPLKPEQSKTDEFNKLLESHTFVMNPEEMATLKESLTPHQASLTDRNWGHLFSGDMRMYRIYADILGLMHDHPMMVAPYGITPARQKSGEMIYRAPLLGNQNQQGQLSMERMSALGVLAAWRWLSTWSKERFGEQSIEMYVMEIEVIPIAEIQSDFSAVAQQPSMQRIEEMLRHMRNFGKDTLKMDTLIHDSRGNLVAIVRTKFGVFSSNKSKRRKLHAASLT
jgi:hypothetical protein